MSLTFTKIENGERTTAQSDLTADQAGKAMWEAMHGVAYPTTAGRERTADAAHSERPLAA